MQEASWISARLGELFDRVEAECPQHGRYFGRVRKGSHELPTCPLCEAEEAQKDKATEELKDRLKRSAVALENVVKPYGIYRPPFGTLDAFDIRGEKTREKKTALTAATRFSQRLLDRLQEGKNSGLGLFLVGSVGTGKTHLATACLDELAKQGIPGFFIRVADLFDLTNGAAASRELSVTALIGYLSRVSCLVLDDLGVQSWSSSEQKRLQQILDGRQANGLPTVFTTNLDGEELVRCLGDRLVSRILGTSYVARFTWSDRRRQKKWTLEEAFGGD